MKSLRDASGLLVDSNVIDAEMHATDTNDISCSVFASRLVAQYFETFVKCPSLVLGRGNIGWGL